MNFVGPFAENQTNIHLFISNLIFATACSETLKAKGEMQGANSKLEAEGNTDALELNKLDENMFIEIMCATPIEKDA